MTYKFLIQIINAFNGALVDMIRFIRHLRRAMSINSQMTDDHVLAELGDRLARLRLDKNFTQSELARQAGVGLRTVQRLESGAVATQLSGFLRVCRVLGIIERFDALVPEPIASPIAQLKQHGKLRQRATGKPLAPDVSKKWKWGDKS